MQMLQGGHSMSPLQSYLLVLVVLEVSVLVTFACMAFNAWLDWRTQ